MKKYWKKLIGPVVVTVLVVGYYAAIAVPLFLAMNMAEVHPIIQAAAMLIPLGIGIGMVAALVSRIKEIRSGEEDDLSQY